jgi:hypothetical protein
VTSPFIQHTKKAQDAHRWSLCCRCGTVTDELTSWEARSYCPSCWTIVCPRCSECSAELVPGEDFIARRLCRTCRTWIARFGKEGP